MTEPLIRARETKYDPFTNALNRLQVSRRDFMRVASKFGMTSTLFGAATIATGVITLPKLATAAESTYKKRFKKKPRVTLKFAPDGLSAARLLIQRSGELFLSQDIEERTDGEIQIDFIGSNQICGQLDCIKKCQQGIIDIYSSSTQNAAASAPYYNSLDYAYMWPTRASMYHFFYHPKSEPLFREPMRRMHGIQVLHSHAELRGLMMGLGWEKKETVTKIETLAGTKNRVTGTQLGRIAMQLMNLNPVPIAWEETLDGLKQGLVDGAETWSSATAFANMGPVVSQDVAIEFFAGNHLSGMNLKSFEKKLTPELQDAVTESSYLAQVYTQHANEASLVNVVGASDPQFPDTVYGRHNVRFSKFTAEAKKECAELCSPEFVPKPWEKWRERINGWAKGQDTYKEMFDIAREIPETLLAEQVEPRRWWKA